MILARVIGTIVSTQKHAGLEDQKLLMVQPVALDGSLTGRELLAVDRVDAGVGDVVLLLQEGAGAQQLLGRKDLPVHTVVVAVVDGFDIPAAP